MMTNNLTSKQSALIAGGIFLFIVTLFFSVTIIPALLMKQHLIEKTEEFEMQLGKYKKSVENTKSLHHEIDKLKKEKINKENFLLEKSVSLAAANLQQQIKSIVESNQAKLISSQPVDNYEEELYPRVTIRVRARSNINALQKILYEIESGKPELFINNATIKKLSSNNRNNNSNDLLDIRFDIFGYMPGKQI